MTDSRLSVSFVVALLVITATCATAQTEQEAAPPVETEGDEAAEAGEGTAEPVEAPPPLIEAAQAGDLERVKDLVEGGAARGDATDRGPVVWAKSLLGAKTGAQAGRCRVMAPGRTSTCALNGCRKTAISAALVHRPGAEPTA